MTFRVLQSRRSIFDSRSDLRTGFAGVGSPLESLPSKGDSKTPRLVTTQGKSDEGLETI